MLPAHLLDAGVIDRYGFELAERLARLARSHPRAVAMAAALAGEAMSVGHACISIGGAVVQVRESWRLEVPDAASWKAQLLESGVAGAPGEYTPLIIDAADRLYLHRYWRYEQDVARNVLARASASCAAIEPRALTSALDRWVGPAGRNAGSDQQRVAVALALLRRFTVITGGPGTGKTTTAARILALLAQMHADRPLRVALAAPTGKAAGRLEQAIRAAKQRLQSAEQLEVRLAAAIPDSAATIHRLLGPRDRSGVHRFNAQSPLPVDVLLIDEVSMVDLALMAKLLAATPRSARLILLGDKDQLASVEAGAVLSSLTAPWRGYSAAAAAQLRAVTGVVVATEDAKSIDARPLGDCVAVLSHSHRFAADSTVAALARATLQGDVDGVRRTIDQAHVGLGESMDALVSMVDDGLAPFVAAVTDGADPAVAFAALDRFRVLCVHRGGARGVVAINRWLEARLRRRLAGDRAESEWFAGRVVMITHNDYNLRLFNGEIGIALPDPAGALRVFFADAHGAFRSFAPARLPAREGGLALTVHKSQGSEFDRVVLVLPEALSPIVTRELLYTAVTRAREEVRVLGNASVFAQGVNVRQLRESGLADALWSVPVA